MGFIDLATLMDKGTPVLLLALIILSVVNSVFIRFMSSSIDNIKDDIVWRDTYEADQKSIDIQFKAVDGRVVRLENKSNNKP